MKQVTARLKLASKTERIKHSRPDKTKRDHRRSNQNTEQGGADQRLGRRTADREQQQKRQSRAEQGFLKSEMPFEQKRPGPAYRRV